MVKIVATGFGATALQSGQIIHFDAGEYDAETPDMRKLEADVEMVDARRIKEAGWGDFADPADAGEDEIARAFADDTATPPAKKPAPRKPAARKPAARKPAAKKATPAPKPAAPAPVPPVEVKPAGEQAKAEGDDPEAGPAAT